MRHRKAGNSLDKAQLILLFHYLEVDMTNTNQCAMSGKTVPDKTVRYIISQFMERAGLERKNMFFAKAGDGIRKMEPPQLMLLG